MMGANLRKIFRARFFPLPAVMAIYVTAALTGASALWAAEDYSGWWLPVNIATEYGQRQDLIFNIILGITGALAAIVYILMLIAFIFHRQRPGRSATYTHSSRRFQIAVISFFTVFVLGGEIFVLGRVTGDMWDQVKNSVPPGSMQVEILAEQFAWNVRYPGADGKFGKSSLESMDEENIFGLNEDDPEAADDIVSSQLHIPVDTPIHLKLRAKDVLHSFFIPVLRVKQDAVPGETIDVWVNANRTGEYELVCAELCGLGHSTMKAALVIESREAFDAWLEEQKQENQ